MQIQKALEAGRAADGRRPDSRVATGRARQANRQAGDEETLLQKPELELALENSSASGEANCSAQQRLGGLNLNILVY